MVAAQALALAGVVASAVAFTAPTSFVGARVAHAASSTSQVTMMAKSASVPFMPKPEKLDGSMAGDVGFDPLGLSEIGVPLNFLREAEIKHGRICMLATVGYFITDMGIHLPGDVHAVSSLEAHDTAVKFGAMSQLLLWISIFEAISTVAVVQMVNGSGRKPGYFGFDPLNFSAKPADAAKYELNEIKNGRLAMLAFSGIVTANALGHGMPYV